jgi:hypothetical protein
MNITDSTLMALLKPDFLQKKKYKYFHCLKTGY